MPEEQEEVSHEDMAAPDKAEPPAEETPFPVEGKGQEKVAKANLPWQVVQMSESVPAEVNILGFFQTGVLWVLVTDHGFYGEYDGTVQKLPVKLIDNS